MAIPALIVAAGLGAAGGLAHAKSAGGENDAVADLSKARITLTQAVGAAEQAGTRRTATSARRQRGHGRLGRPCYGPRIAPIRCCRMVPSQLKANTTAADGKRGVTRS